MLVYLLLAVCATLAFAWALVKRFATHRWRVQLRPAFVGVAAGLFLGIAYAFGGLAITLLLAPPIVIIAYFNLVGRRR
jgi:hypothetical protein